MKRNVLFTLCLAAGALWMQSQERAGIASVSSSVNESTVANLFDNNAKTVWTINTKDIASNPWMMVNLSTPGDVESIMLEGEGIPTNLSDFLDIYVTYDPMNLGVPVAYEVKKEGKKSVLTLSPKYGAHVRFSWKNGGLKKPMSLCEIGISIAQVPTVTGNGIKGRWMDASLPVEERVSLLLAAMTPADKMELLREGWGIPGIPHLGIPDIKKVEAVHGFSYGSGATIFPQSIAQGATWNKKLIEELAGAIGEETKSANAVQAWSPVLDVAQDARWGRCEETYGEDPVLVSKIGGAWVKGYQDKGLITTPKHFGGHGSPLGGRDSHDIGLSEREFREVLLVPFRNVVKNHDPQSVMMAYSDYLGVPVAKSTELLKDILRDEWGFDGFIVSDCGAIGNLTSRKHYTAQDKIEAARQALKAGIATNCGDTYNDKAVILAVEKGEIDMKDIDYTCATMLRTMFRAGLFEDNPCKSLDWDKVYPGWQSPEHVELARRTARESIVLLENKDNILPLSKNLKTIAVIGPGADDMQPGDYTGKPLEGQLRSVLTGIKEAVGANTKVIYEKGCDFFYKDNTDISKAVKAAKNADVTVLVLGDCSNSLSDEHSKKTSGENHDLATLDLQGDQQKLLEAVCATGTPVILVLQSGRPYNISYASENCKGVLVNWLPGQEGGRATADVLFGDYNPAGRLPMTFPRHVGQVPCYYNFKTSGRRYEYSDLEFYPLYRFGYGKSYTTFRYSDLKTDILPNGNVKVRVDVTNTGKMAGDEVVQLYVTDMYASVKTRVTELKDFDRIHLLPGETQTVSFELTPYELSLLDDRMDRVVESGDFKIMAGGCSPAYDAKDGIKDSLGFKDPSDGVSAMINYPYSFGADFNARIAGVAEHISDGGKTVTVEVRNDGNLTDVQTLTMFVGGKKMDCRHLELAPQEKKNIAFKVDAADYDDVRFVTKYKMIK